ncbi:hypothetical protein EDD85DRAFT_947698 [Armillaria nabsnona]|nr:hypothetical protein EDD85DRAFT_947698 [Armillaria nabsnona]
MTPGTIFIDWIENLRGRNGLLAGYIEFIANNVFLSNLCGHISKPLHNTICNIPEICECNDLDAWTKLVTVQDNELHHKCKELEDVIEAMMVACNKCPNLTTTTSNTTPALTVPTAVATENTQPACNNYHFPPCCMNSAPPSASCSSNTPFTYKYQSCLEDDECATLTANNGCFACHDINMPKEEQGFNKCKGRPPSAVGYKWCTPEWVIRWCANKAKGIPLFTIAIITSNASSSTQSQAPAAPAPAPAPAPATAIQVLATMAWLIAAAVPANKLGVLNATNADGTDADANLLIDSDTVSKVSTIPFAVLHLLWNCAVDNHATGLMEPHTNITALVDDGAHLMLIRLQLIDHLQLKHLPLPEPIEIGVAVSNSPSPACKLTE